MKFSTTWIFLHSGLLISTLGTLFTGLRISTAQRDYTLALSPILPQGNVHQLHFYFSILFLVCSLGFILAYGKRWVSSIKSGLRSYHRTVTFWGFVLLPLIALSGLNRYYSWLPWFELFNTHFLLAIIMAIYIGLHALVYFVQYGSKLIKTIFTPKPFTYSKLLWVFLLALGGYLSIVKLFNETPDRLLTQPITINTFIEIDGYANEPSWNESKPLSLMTYGGHNFHEGMTPVSVRSMSNGLELFMYIEWKDDTPSTQHLPLIKTDNGWKVLSDGFERFDERKYYEDKFAVMISNECDEPVAGVMHMGAKPLNDKPANWHGKGFHYTETNSLVDIWHWKAVRTNDMYLADDNYFSHPVNELAGNRRYKGGYLADGKESGSYVMNWKWFNSESITPKRLPKDTAWLDKFQQDKPEAPTVSKNTQAQAHSIPVTRKNHRENKFKKVEDSSAVAWVIPWFSFEPYKLKNDNYIAGTVMPSVMYRSNRFEGDRADVRARGRWESGRWHLEIARSLDTKSQKDVVIRDGVCIWFAAFDHAQIGHTRHINPVKIKFL